MKGLTFRELDKASIVMFGVEYVALDKWKRFTILNLIC
jgi:hypothetical protein